MDKEIDMYVFQHKGYLLRRKADLWEMAQDAADIVREIDYGMLKGSELQAKCRKWVARMDLVLKDYNNAQT